MSFFALDIIEEIIEFISIDSVRYVERTADKIYERPKILKDYPLSGRMVPELMDEKIRELTEGSYRIIYEIISETEITILTVHHSSKQLDIS